MGLKSGLSAVKKKTLAPAESVTMASRLSTLYLVTVLTEAHGLIRVSNVNTTKPFIIIGGWGRGRKTFYTLRMMLAGSFETLMFIY